MRALDEIIVHCTDTRPDWMNGRTTAEKVAEIRRWHVSPPNSWSDIGYHFLIDRNGKVATGRPVEKVGAHVKGHNANSIGISLIGGHGSASSDKFEDHFTPEQATSLRDLITELRRKHGINKVSGHNEYANKACPGFNLKAWYGGLAQKEARKSPVQSTTMQASAVQIAGAAGAGVTAVSALDGVAQLVVVGVAAVIALMAVWIMRERLRKWSEGWK